MVLALHELGDVGLLEVQLERIVALQEQFDHAVRDLIVEFVFRKMLAFGQRGDCERSEAPHHPSELQALLALATPIADDEADERCNGEQREQSQSRASKAALIREELVVRGVAPGP